MEDGKMYKFELDFDAIAKWRDQNTDDLPVHGMISFYKATGIADFIKEHADELGNQVASIDVIFCNFYTQKRIKNFITNQWEIFSLSLLDNNKVKWNTRTYAKGTEHYNHRLSKKVEKSLLYDFLNYCPGLDDELEDNIIIIKVPETLEAEKENSPDGEELSI